MMGRAWSWRYCALAALHANRVCVCGKTAVEVDHRIPVSLGGTGDLENLRPLCRECHRQETARLRREKAAYIAREYATL